MRCCRDCWHKQEYELPELRKKIIYQDQFVTSNLMKLKNPATKGHATVAADPFWCELRDLLFQLRQLQMICCPDSGSHEEESRTSPFSADLKKTYEGLSSGITSKAFDSIKSEQIGKLALAWSEPREPREGLYQVAREIQFTGNGNGRCMTPLLLEKVMTSGRYLDIRSSAGFSGAGLPAIPEGSFQA